MSIITKKTFPPPSSCGVLRAHLLGLRRGGRWLYQQVNFSLNPASILVLRGPNGSGKSSLLRAVAGFLPFTDGQIFYQDTPFYAQAPDSPLSCSWYTHNDGLPAELSGLQAIQFQARLAHIPKERLAALLAADPFAISGFLNNQVQNLSTGQRQRLALSLLGLKSGAGCLWLLDEPNTSLDSTAIAGLDTLLSAHQAAGGYALIASHLPIAKNLTHDILEIGMVD